MEVLAKLIMILLGVTLVVGVVTILGSLVVAILWILFWIALVAIPFTILCKLTGPQ